MAETAAGMTHCNDNEAPANEMIFDNHPFYGALLHASTATPPPRSLCDPTSASHHPWGFASEQAGPGERQRSGLFDVVRRFESPEGSHTDGNGHDLHVCEGQLVIDGCFAVG